VLSDQTNPENNYNIENDANKGKDFGKMESIWQNILPQRSI
jgi:hypothetical protein